MEQYEAYSYPCIRLMGESRPGSCMECENLSHDVAAFGKSCSLYGLVVFGSFSYQEGFLCADVGSFCTNEGKYNEVKIINDILEISLTGQCFIHNLWTSSGE